MPKAEDFCMTTEFDPAEAFDASTAQGFYERIEEVWQEVYASMLTSHDEANAKDYYEGLYRYIDEISWRMKTASMRALERGEWKEV